VNAPMSADNRGVAACILAQARDLGY
jgi:hypothetical protein